MKKFLLAILFIPALIACKNQPTAKQAPEKVSSISKEDSLKIAGEIANFRPENHNSSMELIFGKPKFDIRTIGILVYDGVNDLDVMGPRYVLGQAMGVKTQLISIKKGNIKTVMGVEMVSNTVINSVSQLDILIVPGGFKGTIEAAYDTKLHEWIRRIDQTTKYTGAVCTGV